MRVLVLAILALAGLCAEAQDDAKKAAKEKLNELRKALASPGEEGRLKAIAELGELAEDEAISPLSAKLITDTDAVRIAAAHAVALHRRLASVKGLANAVGPNVARPDVIKAIIEALRDLDMCGSIQVLLGIAEVNKNAYGEEALKALERIGCSDTIVALVAFLQRAELEEKKPDIFEGTDDAPESENKQKNKTLAALAPLVREVLSGLAGKSYGESSKEWTAALGSGKVSFRKTSVYFCVMKEATFEVPSGQAKKCPYGDGKTSHDDLFLKHLRE
jgi:hypothetical protein